MGKINLFIKRMFDITVSLICIALLLVIPVYIIVPIAIKLTSKGPALFRQVRAGKNGKSFTMYKFRTMIVETYDNDGKEIMTENRITKIGKFLRKTSLDETPQLFNILNGTMSIVGPRPMLVYQMERCEGEELRRFEMRPGVTGLAQVKGRNNIRWPERIQYDLNYIKNFNVILDIEIIIKTIFLVFRKEGTDVIPEYRGVDRFSKHYVPDADSDAGKNNFL
ncbi:lipopolysaccharide/colanic/teichoic acid biosynthesis glycosyltransferase [Hungatella effluvii]|uniref:Lipopolysaccharide/colanic/teichoic acid biosynthesis glycosyltransferase n=1 Tax=Hungatella effluvii TaxID=1096246 RepID=A0A2V3Y0P8_9FIRM|nr:sugar transferase [Hungatella effluvii]PXX51490.1 lipopolysaccharide/colanic/teichoic acid biosynthesis glycosyltransferase [Hungatella effluvii]